MTSRARNVERTGSLRVRLTREILIALVILIVGFQATTLGAITLHLYQDARRDANTIAEAVMASGRPSDFALVTVYNRITDPRVWVLRGSTVIASSPNAGPRPRALQQSGFVLSPMAAYQDSVTRGRLRTVVDWPLASDLALLQELVLVVAAVTILAVAAGVLLARWTTRRALEPMKTMTNGVEGMLETQSIRNLQLPSGNDEFTKLASLLNHLLESLDQRWQQDRELVADAAHQVRTPLEVVRGNLDILRTWDNLDLVTRQECLDAIDRTIGEISRVVSDVLAIEYAAGAGGIALTTVSLADLVREVGEDVGALAAAGEGPTTNWHVDAESGSAEVLAQPDYARRALWAVTENALKYTGPTGTVLLTLERDRARSAFGVTVKDTGPGIEAADLPHVFRRFYRGSTVGHIPGTGLGLSMAKTLIEAQRGSIELRSGPGGTLVTLWFRAAEPVEERFPAHLTSRWPGDSDAVTG